MKIVISDYPNTLKRNLDYEIGVLKQAIPSVEVVVHPFTKIGGFFKVMEGAEGLLTAFLPIDDAVLSNCPSLKYISVNATGYNTIDIKAAAKHNVTVCAIKEYCTQEVAEFAMSLILALAKNLKQHRYSIEEKHVWQYTLVAPGMRLSGKTLAVVGFGRIGQSLAALAKAFGMNILAVDPYITEEKAARFGARRAEPVYAAEQADVISNHMIATPETENYFNDAFFAHCLKRPIFINVGRGMAVDEAALLRALNTGRIAAAGLDVLKDDSPDIAEHPLANRPNVILTPHTAFYSVDSMKALQDISCENLICCLQGRPGQARSVIV